MHSTAGLVTQVFSFPLLSPSLPFNLLKDSVPCCLTNPLAAQRQWQASVLERTRRTHSPFVILRSRAVCASGVILMQLFDLVRLPKCQDSVSVL